MGVVVSIIAAVAGVASVLEAGAEVGIATYLGAVASVGGVGVAIGGAAGMKNGMTTGGKIDAGVPHPDAVTEEEVQKLLNGAVSDLEGFIDDKNAILLKNITSLLDNSVTKIEDFVEMELEQQTIENERGQLQAFLLFFMNEYLAFSDAGDPVWQIYPNQYCAYHWQGAVDSFDTCQNLCLAEGKRYCAGIMWDQHDSTCKLVDRNENIGECTGDAYGYWDAYTMTIIPKYDKTFLSDHLAPYEAQLYNIIGRLQQDDVKVPSLGLFTVAASTQLAYFQELALQDPSVNDPAGSTYTGVIQNLARTYLTYAVNQGSENLAAKIKKQPNDEKNIRDDYYNNFLLPVLLWNQLLTQPLPGGKLLEAEPLGNTEWTLHMNQYCTDSWRGCVDLFSQCQNLCFLEGEDACIGIQVSPSLEGGYVPEQYRCPSPYACMLIKPGQTIGQCTGNAYREWDAYTMTINSRSGFDTSAEASSSSALWIALIGIGIALICVIIGVAMLRRRSVKKNDMMQEVLLDNTRAEYDGLEE